MKTTKSDEWFSIFIRLRDSDENGYCQCCTCGKHMFWRHVDCGHFIKRQYQATRFNEANCAAQCKHCNYSEQGAESKHQNYILKKYGLGVLELLISKKRTIVKRTAFEMKQIELFYKAKAMELLQEKGLKL